MIFENSLSFISAVVVFISGFIVSNSIAHFFKLTKVKAWVLYLWHSLFCVIYYYYVINYGGDAEFYYDRALYGEYEFQVGTVAVINFTSFLINYLKLDFFGCFLFYNILGSIGLIAMAGSIKAAVANSKKNTRVIASIFVFLPSVSFWSSAIGKDSISFLAVNLALWAALQFERRIRMMLFSVLLIGLVRPHIAGIMMVSLSIATILNKDVNILKRIFLALLTTIATILAIPFVAEYTGLGGNINSEVLVNYIELRQSYNMSGGGGVDISSMSLPMQLLTYMFRPVIFEASSISSLAASVDNLVLMIISLMAVKVLLRKKKNIEVKENRIFMWVFSILVWLVFSITTANLGIAVRQKWMFVPILVYLLLSIDRNNKKESLRNFD